VTRSGRSAFPVLAVSLALGGCYSYSSLATDQPAPAQYVEITLNDRGRLALERNVGPEVMTVAGSVGSVSDSGFVLRVALVTDIHRGFTKWAGEPVTVQTDWVRQVRERRFSGVRTAILIGSTAGAVALAAATPLVARIFGDSNGPNGGDGGPVDH
jgi:hypothetical protein